MESNLKRKVLAISGSTRQHSTNHALIKAIANLAAAQFDVVVYNGITKLPHYNPDGDNSFVTAEVADFRQQLSKADGVIICTPEYAHGVPGCIKNAVDWTVSSGELVQKPVMLITAATDGSFAHKAFTEILIALNTSNTNRLQLLISFAKTKISEDGRIISEQTLNDVTLLINEFVLTINNKDGG